MASTRSSRVRRSRTASCRPRRSCSSSFIGFDAVSSSAEETINPNKTLPRGILISLAVSTVLYIIMTLIMTGAGAVQGVREVHRRSGGGRVLETGLNWLAFIVNLGALIGMTTVMLVQLYGQSRICYAMSRDGLFPSSSAKCIRSTAHRSRACGSSAF